jgi:8-oxo-dGTP pyrophosphatase MutT (NUDIX family)
VIASISLAQVRAALALPDFASEAAQRRMAPRPRTMSRSDERSGLPRQASVLVLLYPAGEGLAFALERRATNPHDVHGGEIGLPGGAREGDETPLATALREAREEMGVSTPIEVLGRLRTLYIPPSDFDVHPFVGYAAPRPVWQPDSSEVAEVLDCPLAWLLDDGRKRCDEWEVHGAMVLVPWYDLFGHKVWGATAIILSELEQRLRAVSGP